MSILTTRTSFEVRSAAELPPASSPSQQKVLVSTHLRDHPESQVSGNSNGQLRVRGPHNSQDWLLAEVYGASESCADIRAGVHDLVAQGDVHTSQQR